MSQVRPQAGMRHLLLPGQPLLTAATLATLTALPHFLQNEASKTVFVVLNDPEGILTLDAARSYSYAAQKAFFRKVLPQLQCNEIIDEVYHPASLLLRSMCLLQHCHLLPCTLLTRSPEMVTAGNVHIN